MVLKCFMKYLTVLLIFLNKMKICALKQNILTMVLVTLKQLNYHFIFDSIKKIVSLHTFSYSCLFWEKVSVILSKFKKSVKILKYNIPKQLRNINSLKRRG